MEKDWPKNPSDLQLQEAQKKKKRDPDRAITPVAEAVHVPAQLVLPGSPQAKKLCRSTFSEAELPQAKKRVLCLCTQGCFSHVQLFVTL